MFTAVCLSVEEVGLYVQGAHHKGSHILLIIVFWGWTCNATRATQRDRWSLTEAQCLRAIYWAFSVWREIHTFGRQYNYGIIIWNQISFSAFCCPHWTDWISPLRWKQYAVSTCLRYSLYNCPLTMTIEQPKSSRCAMKIIVLLIG